jgi:hypothetical protein
VRGRRDRRRRVAVLLGRVGRHVARYVVVDEHLPVTRGGNSHHGRQGLVADRDEPGGVLGDVAVGRHDHDDRLADVVDLVLGQGVRRTPVRQRRVRDQQWERLAGTPVEVVIGVDRDQAIDVEGGTHVDVGDAGMGVRAPYERGGEGVLPEVVEVAATPGQQSGVLDPGDPLTEELGRHAGAAASRLSSAARSTAATMFW